MPLNGRNFLALAQLSDGVVLPPGGTRGDALQQAGPLPNVGGQRSGHNIYLLDGFKVTDELFNNLVINPSVDSIQEFKIQKSQYPAEFGGKASALINVATRSRHQRVSRERVRVRAARSVSTRATTLRRKTSRCRRCGRTSSAAPSAVRSSRNSTFFFASYEGQRIRRSLTRTFSVPVGRGARRRLLVVRRRFAIRSARGGCAPFSAEPHSRRPHRSDRGGVPAARAAADVRRGVPEPDRDRDAGHRRRSGQRSRIDRRAGDADQLFARFSTFDADERQPFGTSSLQETLVPGFGRDVRTSGAQCRRQSHARLRHESDERAARGLAARQRRTGQRESRRRLRRAGRTPGRHPRST